LHSTTGRILKKIRDLDDKSEIELIKKNIINALSKMNNNIDKININDKYVKDISNIKINRDNIIEKYIKNKKNLMIQKNCYYCNR